MNFWFAQVVQKLLTEISLSFCICDQLLMIKYFISVLHEEDHSSIYKLIVKPNLLPRLLDGVRPWLSLKH